MSYIYIQNEKIINTGTRAELVDISTTTRLILVPAPKIMRSLGNNS